MSAFVSLLRGINVGGQKKIRMEALRDIYQQLGFTRIRTYLQSGNVVFDSVEEDKASLVRQIEQHIEQAYGYAIKVFVLWARDFKCILADNPFLKDKEVDQSKLHVSFLYLPPDEPAWGNLTLPANIPDKYVRGDSVIYTYYTNGYARTKISASFFERNLGVAVTDRNWNTMVALYKMAVER